MINVQFFVEGQVNNTKLTIEKQRFWNKHRVFRSFCEPLVPLFWIPGDIWPGFQGLGCFLACMLTRLCAVDFSNSPLVQYLQISWQLAWQPNISNPQVCLSVTGSSKELLFGTTEHPSFWEWRKHSWCVVILICSLQGLICNCLPW